MKANPHKLGTSEALAWDDLTGMRLDGDKVIEARQREIEYVRKMKVWKIAAGGKKPEVGRSSRHAEQTSTRAMIRTQVIAAA